MALAPYNQAPQSLQDLLAMQTTSSGPSVGPPMASQPSSVDTEGLLTAQQRSTLLEQLLNPPQTTAEPADEQPQWGKKLAGSFADAFNNIATIYAGGPNLQSNYLGDYLNTVERKNAERTRRAEIKAERDSRDRGDKAKFLLGADDSARMRNADRAGREELKQLTLAAQAADRDARVQAAAETVTARREEIASREKIAGMETKARMYGDSLQAKLHAKKLTDEADKDQHAEYAKSRQFVIGKKAEITQMLSEGKTTPDQVLQEWQDTLDSSDLTGDYREAADAFFKDKIGSILMRYAPRQGPENAPPPVVSQEQIDAARQSVRQGPRY